MNPRLEVPAAADAWVATRAARKLVLFLLSPRLIDFDTYLPTAMALKEARPSWDIRFVTFSKANADFIRRNPDLMVGLERCGAVHCMEAAKSGNPLGRQFQRLKNALTLLHWILAAPRPVVFAGTTFGTFPYVAWWLAAKIRGGSAFILLKSRATEENHQLAERDRQAKLSQVPRSLIERLAGPLYGGLVYYHDRQDLQLYGLRLRGRISNDKRLKIGLPTLLPVWQRLIKDRTTQERQRLEALGCNVNNEIYAFFPVKGFAARTLRTRHSPAESFRLILTTLRKLRPNALILLRLHPVSQNESFVHQLLAELADPNIVLSLAHPEVLINLAHRVIINGPTNIQTTVYSGRFVDCTDYSERHYSEFGERSLVEGYGTVFVRPTGADFEQRFARALEDDGLFDGGQLDAARRALVSGNPPALDHLIERMEIGQNL